MKVKAKHLNLLQLRMISIRQLPHLRLLLRRMSALFKILLSSILQDVSSIQREVRSINVRVEQCQLDIHECLKHHHPDED
jgi:hypothetical protein